MKNKQRTFNGIKRFYPNLDYEDWLKICAGRQHFNYNPDDVVKGLNNREEKNELD